MKRIYLDNSATTPMLPEVLAAMLPFMTKIQANPSSIHTPGQQARAAVEEARSQAAELIGAKNSELIFTGSGTESDNLAVMGVVRALGYKGKHIITSSIEHAAVRNAFLHLEKEGFDVTWLHVDRNGLIDMNDLREAIRDDTILVSVMHANNEIGTIEPIKQIAEIAHSKGAVFHTDAVQSVGKIPVNVDDFNVDMLSFSAHKFNGPKGIGALYIRTGTPCFNILFGGHQEMGKRPGTENVPAIVGLGKACSIVREKLSIKSEAVRKIRDYFENKIVDRIPNVAINAKKAKRIPSVSNISFPGAEGEAIVISLDIKGIATSTGSACSAGALEPSHVLKAIKCPKSILHSSVRFSFSADIEISDVDYVVNVVAETVEQVRKSMGRL